MRRIREYVGAGALSLALVLGAAPMIVSAAQVKPPTTTSWYVYMASGSTDQTLYDWAYNRGRELGQRDLSFAGTQSSIVILDFGQPWYQNGSYGVWSFTDFGRFVSVGTIREAVRQYARGYYAGRGSDTTSIVRVLIGTNNYGSGVTYSHGQAWAWLVRDADSSVINSGYGGQVKVRGASDIEMNYSSPTTAKNWINGYNSAYVAPYVMYNYGDAGGCPQSGTTANPGWCNNGWTQDDVNYVTLRTAAGMYPLPQIYSTGGGNAKSWQQIALYGKVRYGYLPTISGPLSQRAAWDQRCAPRNPLPPECVGVNNTAQQAWDQMWNALNSDSRTAGSMTWSTDIKWK